MNIKHNKINPLVLVCIRNEKHVIHIYISQLYILVQIICNNIEHLYHEKFDIRFRKPQICQKNH